MNIDDAVDRQTFFLLTSKLGRRQQFLFHYYSVIRLQHREGRGLLMEIESEKKSKSVTSEGKNHKMLSELY